MDIPYTYYKLRCMRLDIICDQILFITNNLFGCVKNPKQRIFIKNNFTPKIKL